MGSLSRPLAILSVFVLALTAFTVQADTVSVAANLAAIQQAINDAPENSGRVISIAQGNVEMGTSFLRLNKWGVSLQGAGPGLTVFQTSQTTQNPGGVCYAPTEGTPLLTVCQRVNPAPAPPAGSLPNIIEGITFKNSDSSPFSPPYNGAEKGIGIIMSGPSPANPSIIRNCEFINLWKNGPTGIGIELVDASGTRPNNWRIENCRFDGSKTGVYVNGNSDITFANNTFTRFRAGILNDANDKSYNLAITGNDFVGGWTALNRPSLADVVVAISLSANAGAAGDSRNWNITNNDINNVQQGIDIRFQSPGPSSLTAVDISYNSIVADFCSVFRPCFNIINSSPQNVTVTGNWWGSADGPNTNRFQNTSGGIIYDPWIESFVRDPSCTSGFCPTDVVLSNKVVPVITSMEVDPSLVAAGSTVNVTVEFNATVDGTLTFVSTPEGITCPDVVLTQQDFVEVTCTVDAAATADTYTITAEVTTSGGSDAKSTELTVCSNQEPWPFTADVQACEECTFNCVTGVFSCSNCSCSCPHDGYDQYGKGHYEKPYYGDRYGDGPGHHRPDHRGEDRPGYGYGPGDDEHYYRGESRPGYGYGHGDEDRYAHDGPHTGRPYGYRRDHDEPHHKYAAGDAPYEHSRDDAFYIITDRQPAFVPFKIPLNATQCQPYGGSVCVCNPEPLTNATNCAVVSYDACENKLTCTP